MADDIMEKARALLGNKGNYSKKELPGIASLERTKKILNTAGKSLDVYFVFDTTGSMGPYIDSVRDGISDITGNLLSEGSGMRLSINGVGDHCDGHNMVQMFNLTNKPDEARGSIESIVMTSGGDEPEAYECIALELAKRLPEESAGRKRAVVFVGDSYPHGMADEPCERQVDYAKAFEALKTVSDGFYFVGCNPSTYGLQRKLIDKTRAEKEKFIELGTMVEVLPELLIALARKEESAKALADYLKNLESIDAGKANKVKGFLK